MSDASPGAGPDSEQGGVFGKLPAARPGTRSPRRDSAKGTRKPAPAPAKQRPKPAAQRPQSRPPASGEGREPADEPAAPEAGAGLDDLAWAGVAAVAEAATLGVRLANRALGALRDGVDRR